MRRRALGDYLKNCAAPEFYKVDRSGVRSGVGSLGGSLGHYLKNCAAPQLHFRVWEQE